MVVKLIHNKGNILDFAKQGFSVSFVLVYGFVVSFEFVPVFRKAQFAGVMLQKSN